MAANTESLRAATDFVQVGAREAELPEERLAELALLLEEIFMNVCSYAYGQGEQGVVALSYSIPSPGELSVEVADQGVEFNPLTQPPPDLTLDLDGRGIGGLGIFLVKSLAPAANYSREHNWNRLSFRLSAKQ